MSDVIGSGTGETVFRDINTLNYEQARDELAEIVRILELGQMSLDESLKYWERGELLAKFCEQQLQGAARKIEQVLDAGQGSEQDASADADN